MNVVHRVRLILAGILVALGAASLAQIGGSGVSAPPGPPVVIGSFVVTWNVGCTVDQNMTIDYYRVGDLVTLVPAQVNLACTGNSSLWSSDPADFPAELVPDRKVYVMVDGFSGGADARGMWILCGSLCTDDGTMFLDPGGWTASGARQWNTGGQVPMMTYPLL